MEDVKLTSAPETEDHWISISDMMSGLMIIFLFIAVSYMIKVNAEKDKIKEIAITYNRLQNDLYNDLFEEFESNLDDWDAIIVRETMSFRFNEPEILFDIGECTIKPRFELILKDFFPRYIEILTDSAYKNDIEEIRTEGHTSTEWKGVSGDFAYFNNMQLSQERTRSVMEKVIGFPEISVEKEWLKQCLTANGLSSGKVIFHDDNGSEDKTASRRVEFRVRTNAEKELSR